MSELRFDPLERQWVLIAPERGRRPQDFLPPPRAVVDRERAPCPFCLILAGHGPQTRIAERRLRGDRVLVLANRFPVLSVEVPTERRAIGPYDAMSGIGAHEVIVETERHDVPFRAMAVEQRAVVLLMWKDRVADLMRDRRLQHIQVFRNDGPRAGATLEHAHSQVVATPLRPQRVARMVAAATEHWLQKERCLLCDILAFEADPQQQPVALGSSHRVVAEDGGFIAWCPYASAHPFEVHVAPRRHEARFTSLDEHAALALSRLLGRVLMALHEALSGADLNLVLDLAPSPDSLTRGTHGLEHLDHAWHWRLTLVPRLLPYGGFELGTDLLINPTSPEDAAAHLRSLLR